jgi:Domain of unknown function (DUF222)
MGSSSREAIVEAFDALEADFDRALELSFDPLTTPERLAMLQRCERFRRRLPAIEHPLINQVGQQADATELGGKLPAALANRLRINRGERLGAFTRLPIWASAKRSPANHCRPCCLPPPRRSGPDASEPATWR